MSDISVFSFGSSVVRTTTDSTGGIWFCAMDVAQCIEHSNGRTMLNMLDKDDVNLVYTLDNSAKNGQNLSYIRESGLYEILFKSPLPKCKPFQKWLSNEVLPSIRKTGSYGTAKPTTVIGAIALISQALTEQEERLNCIEAKVTTNGNTLFANIINQEEVNGNSRLTAAQVSELDSEMHKKFLAMGRNTLAASVLKKQIKQKWLTPPLTTKTYKDCASKDFPEIIKFVKTFRFGGR
jgi:prophage antirepressor-like protein